MAEPDSTQVLVGPATIYVAPLGSSLPPLGIHGEFPVVWPVAWRQVGYTEAGVDFAYTPTITEIHVDEATAPVGDVLSKEQAVLSAVLAEATLQNLNAAIAASTYVDNSGSTGVIQLSAGTKPLAYTMVGVQGNAPGTGKGRILIFQKAIAQAAVSMKMSRTKNTTIPVAWHARQISGVDLYNWWDLASTAS